MKIMILLEMKLPFGLDASTNFINIAYAPALDYFVLAFFGRWYFNEVQVVKVGL